MRYAIIIFTMLYLAGCTSDKSCVMKVGSQQLTLKQALDAFQKSSPNYKRQIMTDSSAKSFCEIRFAGNLLYLEEAVQLGITKNDSVATILHDQEQQMMARLHGPLYNQIISKIKPPQPKQLQELYDKRKWEYKLAHIMVPTQSLADSLARAIEKGADFSGLAVKYSFDNRWADNKGVWKEWFLYGSMGGDFDDLVLRFPPGVPAGPVHSRYGYHIVMILDKKPRKDIAFEKMTASLENLYKSIEESRAWLRYQQKLPARYDFQIIREAGRLVQKAFYRDEQGSNRINAAALSEEQNNIVLAQFKGGSIRIQDFIQSYTAQGPLLLPPLHRIDFIEAFAQRVAMDELLYIDGKSRGLDRDPDFQKETTDLRNRTVTTVVFRRMLQPFTISEDELKTKYNSEPGYNKFPYTEMLPFVRRAVTTDKELAEEKRQLEILKGKYELEYCQSGLNRLVSEMNKIVKQESAAQK
jgi:parvulin-like peptidyl-prolyl isomerase